MAESEVVNKSQKLIQEQLVKGKIALLEQRLYEISDRLKALEDTIKAVPKRAKQDL